MSTPANFNGARPVIDPDNAAMLLIDHQSGLFQTIGDMPFTSVRAHATALARMATLAKMPVITTASVPQGPNGPLIPEIHDAAPHAQYVARKGEINAWDNPEFVAAVKATGRKQLIIAGTITSVCMAFRQSPPLPMATRCSQSSMRPAPIRRWPRRSPWPAWCRPAWYRWTPPQWPRRSSAPGTATMPSNGPRSTKIFPNYQLLIESYLKAQEVQKSHEPLDSQRS